MSQNDALGIIAAIAVFLTIAGTTVVLAANEWEDRKLRVVGVIVLIFAALHALPPLIHVWTKAIGG